MPYIILLTHGRWGEELIKGTEMMVGSIKNIFAFSLFPEQSVESFLLKIEEVLKELPEETIIITDLFGGTTSNAALVLYKKYKCYVISGLDIAMLIAADELRTKYKGNELISKIRDSSLGNCRNIGQLIDKQYKTRY